MSDEKRGRYLLYNTPGFKAVPYGPRPRKRKRTNVPVTENVSKIKFNYLIFLLIYIIYQSV